MSDYFHVRNCYLLIATNALPKAKYNGPVCYVKNIVPLLYNDDIFYLISFRADKFFMRTETSTPIKFGTGISTCRADLFSKSSKTERQIFSFDFDR